MDDKKSPNLWGFFTYLREKNMQWGNLWYNILANISQMLKR